VPESQSLPPETRYVSVADADVAYQVFGNGVDLLLIWGLGSHVEYGWESPIESRFRRRLAGFARVIMLDRRGNGASDGVTRGAIPTWEDWTEDILAVVDKVGSTEFSVLAEVDAGPIGMLFAALHPERVRSLILANTFCRALVDHDFPIGLEPEGLEEFVSFVAKYWGTTEWMAAGQPSLARDSEYLRWLARTQRASATPRTAAAQYRYILNVDVRDALPMIQAPTLVLHNVDNGFIPVAQGRYLAEHIQGAELITFKTRVDVDGVAVTDPIIDATSRFVTGRRAQVETDRVLATVLFLDIVGSTERLAALGDRHWRQVLDRHDQLVRSELARFRGHEVQTTGDGFVATFDGPARAIRCSQAIIDGVTNLGIEVRAGLHIGECELRGDDVAGIAVHIAARVGALAAPGEILVSSTIKDLVAGSDVEFREPREYNLKGVPGVWKLFVVAS
jgi:class 3 adenylate cyclase/alpha-beta hydrolase superfamily lysophospholipase